MKNVLHKFLLAAFALLLSFESFAADRAQLVQSRLQGALSAIMPRTDFLVIVNRIDNLDDGGSVSVDGSLKMLPGLQLGVNSRGDLVRQDQGAGSYNGPISIQVMIEEKVRPETYKTIEKVLPDIVGGLKDTDELRISTAPLRQPPIASAANSSPQISINNGGDPKDQTQENIKFLSLILLTGGLFFWFLSRFMPNQKSDDGQRGSARNQTPEATEKDAQEAQEVKRSDFAVLDPESVALFLLKEVRDEREHVLSKWIKFAPSTHQRDVFKCLPSWILTHLQELISQLDDDEANDPSQFNLHDLFNEMALVEQTFKSNQQRAKAFLQWFPAEALRKIPRRHQQDFSTQSRKTLWSLRPDLGNFVRVDHIQIDQMMEDPTDEEIKACVDELQLLPSVVFEKDNTTALDLPSRWATLINQLDEFSPIKSQLEQASGSLKAEDYERLLGMVAHLQSPLSFDENTRKSWLRTVDPSDYVWWLELLGAAPAWDLSSELRPMRLAMFQDALDKKPHREWGEESRKDSSERILTGFREVLKLGSHREQRKAG